VGYPYHSPRRITSLQYLVKLLALQGQGATTRFNDLAEEVALLKKVNYGEGWEDKLEDASRIGDLVVYTIQAVVAMQQERLQRQPHQHQQPCDRIGEEEQEEDKEEKKK